MKRFAFVFIFIWTIVNVFSQNTINEKFETGLPSSAPSTETTYNLSSGSWKIKGAYMKSDNGSNRLAMNTSAYAISPPLSKPISISFFHRGSGSGKIVSVEKSTDDGINWTSIGSATVSSSSTYAQTSLSVGEAGTKNVLLRFTCNSATIYLDDLQIVSSQMVDEPSVQASLNLKSVAGNQIELHTIPGNGEGRLLIYSKDSIISWQPQDGVTYTNLPRSLDENIVGVYSGNFSDCRIDALEAGSNYYFQVFEYNGTNENTNYLNNTPGTFIQKTLEVPTITISPSTLHFGKVKTGTKVKRIVQISAKYLPVELSTIKVKSSEHFSVSTNSGNGYSDSILFENISGTLNATNIYIQFSPLELKEYTFDLTANAGETQAILSLNGIGSNTDAKTYYIAPEGNDNGDGSFDSPWYNLQKAVDAVSPGDTILVRGGTYYPSMKKDGSKTTVRLTASGTAEKKITIKNFPNEWPVLNFKDQPKKASVRGIQLDGDWWHIYGLHITQAGDNGIKLEGNHNLIERCTFSYNDDTGLQLGFGHSFSDTHPGISSNDGSFCSYNSVIDCDAYLNCDADNFGSDADGFACKMHNGKGNRFIRCRAWDNADDAWDLFETDFPVYLIECWAWGSGRASNFGWVEATGSFQGNGNAIKLGGNGTGGSSKGKHEAWNCIAFNCNKTGSVKGFDQNSHSDGEKIVNCLAFGNGYDFMFENSNSGREYYNNICMGNIEIGAGSTESNNAMLSTSNKAWSNVVRGFGYSDFASLSEEDAKAPRAIDGSLPKKFGRLKSGSILIDKGLDLNPPFTSEYPFIYQTIYGLSRDIGPYELEEGEIKTGIQLLMSTDKKQELKILPVSDSEIVVQFSVMQTEDISIDLYNLQGMILQSIFQIKAEPGIKYQIPLNVVSYEKGFYFCRLNSKSDPKIVKFLF